MKTIFTICLSALLACNGTFTQHPANTNDITAQLAVVRLPDTTTLQGEWYLQPVLALDTATGQRPVIVFDMAKTHFSGSTGCNPMKGIFWYSDKDSSLSFSDKFVNSKMTCPGYNEQGFIKSLMNTNHYRLEKGMLILLTDNTELSKWTRRPAGIAKTSRA